MRVDSQWWQQCTYSISVAVNQYLQKVPRNGIAGMPGLPEHPLFWVPSNGISIRTTYRRREGFFCLAAHSQRKGRWGCYFLLLLLWFLGFLQQRDAGWLSKVSPCKCFPSQGISVLPVDGTEEVVLSALTQLSLPCLSEKSTPLFSSLPRACHYWCAVTLTNYRPTRGLPHPSGMENQGQKSRDFCRAGE